MRSTRTKPGKVSFLVNFALYCAAIVGMVAVLCFTLNAEAQTYPVMGCDMEDGIGSVVLEADVPGVEILDATEEIADGVPYCLVKVLVPEAINIWVGLPMDGMWNERLQSLGGGVYCGSVSPPTSAVSEGYVGITTDTGHSGFILDGSFGMLEPGVPNIPLQIDFSYRSLHLMAVIGKQLIEHFYEQQPLYSYWNG